MRKLAERTTRATKEIAETIGTIQQETQKASESMKDTYNVVNRGKQATAKTEEILSKIVKSVSQAKDMIRQIDVASSEMGIGAEAISKTMEGINRFAQRSLEGIEKMADMAKRLGGRTNALKNIMLKPRQDRKRIARASWLRSVSAMKTMPWTSSMFRKSTGFQR